MLVILAICKPVPSPVANSQFYRYHKNMKRLNPLNDYLFLKLMGEEGDEVQCLAFLNAVLGSKSNRTEGSQPVRLIKILENRTFTAEVIGEKTSILDVRVETDTGEKINIEVQLKDLHHMERRTLFYYIAKGLIPKNSLREVALGRSKGY